MPSPIIKSFSKQTGKSVKEVEKLWKDAEKEASKMGKKENYAYITGILKSMLGIDESFTDYYKNLSKQFLNSDKKTLKDFIEKIEGSVSTEFSDKPEKVLSGKKKIKDKDTED